MNTLQSTISLKQLREQFPQVIDSIARGQSYTVMKRSKPVFQISPVADEGQWQTIVDFTEIDKQGVPIEDVLKGLRKLS